MQTIGENIRTHVRIHIFIHFLVGVLLLLLLFKDQVLNPLSIVASYCAVLLTLEAICRQQTLFMNKAC